MTGRTRIASCALTAVMALTSIPATAADNGLGMSYLFGYQGYPHGLSLPNTPTPPYFAIHPPVYYGQRYTRPYGASPFAAWPQLRSSDDYRPQRHTNRWQTGSLHSAPCCSSTQTSSAPIVIHSTAAPEPLVVDNPYYQPGADAQAAELKFTTVD